MKKKFKSFRKKSGTLIPFSIKKSFPLKPKRIFFVNGKNPERIVKAIQNREFKGTMFKGKRNA